MIAHEAARSYYGDYLVDRRGNWLYILYPEILIRDMQKRTHIIRDLILRINVERNKITSLAADRFTMTDIEYACNNYIHSHVSGASWGGFCLGNSDVGDLINQSTQGEFTEDQWCLFFLTMENFLQIESDSPYKRLANLTLVNASKTNVGHFTEGTYYKKFKQMFPEYKFELTLNSRTKLLELELNTQFYKDFALVLPDEFKGVYDDTMDKARQVRSGKEKLFTGTTGVTFEFKGNTIKQNIISTVEIADIAKDYPLENICGEITRHLNNKIYETSRIKNNKPITKDKIRNLSEYLRGDMELAQDS